MENSEIEYSIINYLIEQLHTKNINQISVVEIILEKILFQFDQLQKENLPHLNNVDMTNVEEIKNILYANTLEILLFFEENKKYIRVLLESTDIVHFMDILHSTYYNHFLVALPELLSKKFDELTLKNYSLYMTSGVKAITEEWFLHEFKEKPESVANRILDMLAPALSELYCR